MLVEIEKKLHQLLQQMYEDLLNSGTINKQNHIIKPQTFLDIIEKTEKDVHKLEMLTVSEAGVTIHREAANLIFKTMDLLRVMKETMSVKPYANHPQEEEIATREPKPTKPSVFTSGIKKLFEKITNRKTKLSQRTK